MDMKTNLWITGGYVKTVEDRIGCKYKNINANEENRINTVANIATISRGLEKSKNPKKLFEMLSREAAPNISYYKLEDLSLKDKEAKLPKVAGRSLEYCPVILRVDIRKGDYFIRLKESTIIMKPDDFNNVLGKWSYMYDLTSEISLLEKLLGKRSYLLLTNLRTLLNAEFELEDIPYNPSVPTYFIIEAEVPYFVFAQMRTHGALTQVAVSERKVTEDKYWIPDDFLSRLNTEYSGKPDLLKDLESVKNLLDEYNKNATAILDRNDIDVIENKKLLNELYVETTKSLVTELLKYSPLRIKQLFKDLGYKKEIYNRWPEHMKFKTFIIGGYLDNPYQWGHFLLEREAYDNLYKTWTQKETKLVAKEMRNLINDYRRKENDGTSC